MAVADGWHSSLFSVITHRLNSCTAMKGFCSFQNGAFGLGGLGAERHWFVKNIECAFTSCFARCLQFASCVCVHIWVCALLCLKSPWSAEVFYLRRDAGRWDWPCLGCTNPVCKLVACFHLSHSTTSWNMGKGEQCELLSPGNTVHWVMAVLWLYLQKWVPSCWLPQVKMD